MSKSSACNLEEVMRGLSISSPPPLASSCSTPAQVVGGGKAISRLKDEEPADDLDKDDVFVGGVVGEARGNDNDLAQRELLDSTDALLMDATNKMDDTAFLDEVINRNCRSYGSTDDDYIDEVIARSSFLYRSFEPHKMFEGLSNDQWRICWMVIMET